MPVELRNTRQKEAIRAAFQEAGRPLSPEEALALAQQRASGMSIATVYRNISTLMKDEWLTAVDLPGEARRYEVSGKRHHHHFHCTLCGKVFELAGCGLVMRHRLPAGFQAERHEFFLYGSCDECGG